MEYTSPSIKALKQTKTEANSNKAISNKTSSNKTSSMVKYFNLSLTLGKAVSLLWVSSLFLPTVAFSADPAASGDLTRDEVTYIIMNQDYLDTVADLKVLNNNRLSQPPNWKTTVANANAANTISSAINITKDIEGAITSRRTGGIAKMKVAADFTSKFSIEKANEVTPGGQAYLKTLNISNLMSATTLPSGTDASSINDLIKMVTDPFSEGVAPSGAVSTTVSNPTEAAPPSGPPQAGANDAGESLVNISSLAIPLTSFARMQAIRKKQGDADTGASLLSLLETESTRRVIDKDNTWYSNLAITPAEGILKEIAHMKALNVYYEYEALKSEERKSAMLAINLSTDAKATMHYKSLLDAIASSSQLASESAKAMESELDEEKRKQKEEAKQAEKDAKDAKKDAKKEKVEKDPMAGMPQ